MKFSKKYLSKAITHITNEACLDDEKEGGRKLNALSKAIETIEKNNSIQFWNGTLEFTSMWSNKKRVVTAHGCHESCDCKGLTSYHSALYKIIAEYIFITPEEIGQRFKVNNQVHKGAIYEIYDAKNNQLYCIDVKETYCPTCGDVSLNGCEHSTTQCFSEINFKAFGDRLVWLGEVVEFPKREKRKVRIAA